RADLLLALEALETRNIALEGHQGDLDRHALAGLPVVGLEDRRHVAPCNQVRELEAAVEKHPGAEVAGAARGGRDRHRGLLWRCVGAEGGPGRLRDLLPVAHL